MRNMTVLFVLALGLTACADTTESTATEASATESTDASTDGSTIMGRDAGCFVLMGVFCPVVTE